tara:strand:- start:177 stop:362 length:186 start_codon:yes stop_codon:yes gene_type:complete
MQNYHNITDAKYLKGVDGKNAGIKCIINGENWSVPMDEFNSHYAEIKRQVDAGELTIEDAD